MQGAGQRVNERRLEACAELMWEGACLDGGLIGA